MLNLPADFKPEFPRVIDSTMRTEFVSCEQQFFQAFIMKRTPKGGSVHLTAGAAYAKGLEVIRTLVYGPEKLSVRDALVEALPHVWAEYGDFPVPEGYEHKSPNAVMRALVAYFDRYSPDRDHLRPVIKSDGMPAVEFTFTFPLQIEHPDTKEPLLYAGRFDMLGIYNDLLWVVDDKTASSLGSHWDRQWALRGQLTGYCFAAQNYGYPTVGAIVRGTSFLKTGAFGFSEPIEYRPDWQLERWWVQLHRDVARMIACWQDKTEEHPYGYWGYNLAEACTSFGGCPFVGLCTKSNPEEWAKSDYEFRDWSPLDKNPMARKQIVSSFAS